MTHRRLRLLSGLVMFAYIASHLLNHGLGVVSLALAESGLRFEMAFWRTPIMTILLYGAVAIHFALALWTLYSRRDWRLPGVEALRLAAGFSFPLLLINHAVSTRLGDALFGITPSYTLIITNLLASGRKGMRLALLAPGWLHGCLGLWITLQRFRAMQRIKRLLVTLVILVPVLAAAGFLRMASESLGYRAATSDQFRCFASQNGTRELGCQSSEDLSLCRFLILFTWSPAHVFPNWPAWPWDKTSNGSMSANCGT